MAVTDSRLLNRRDTAANWASEDPVLAEGEWGYDVTNSIYKMGDGVTPWSGLPDGAVLSDDAPEALGGAADAGTSDSASRSDHGHPNTGLVLDDDFRLTNSRDPNAHEHPAAEVTSGTFSVARGGTGQSSLTAGRYLRGNGTSSVQSRTASEVRADLNVPLSTDVVFANVGVIVVDHGADANVARPTGACVIWRGSVEPNNAIDGDIYIEMS